LIVPLIVPLSVRLSVLLSALGLGSMACGPGLVAPAKHQGPPVAVIKADVIGALEGGLPEGDVRGALIWSAYNPALLDCVAAVPPFTPPLDFTDPADEEVAHQLSLCLTLHLDATIESAGVPLDATFPSSFDMPITSLPDPTLLTGPTGAQLGLAAVNIYVDGNTNGQLDLVEPGTYEAADTVIGSSSAVAEDDTRHSLVVFREGELSPLWTLFRAIYDCPESVPPGFSVVDIQLSEDLSTVTCTVGEGPITVRLSDSDEMRAEVCLPQPEQSAFVEATDDGRIPGGAAIACEDGVAYYSTSADAICPLIGHYDLWGCRDTSSEDACRASFFDHTDAPPSWWPCQGGYLVAFVPVADFATDGLDVLGTVFPRSTAMFELADLMVRVETIDGFVELTGDALTLTDADENGWANQGDSITVTEVDNLFSPSSAEGIYRVETWLFGEKLHDSAYQPVGISPTELPLHTLEVIDAPGTTFADGELLFTIESRAGAGSYLLEELSVTAYLFGKANTSLPADMSTLVDRDGDGRFGAGDAIEVRMGTSLEEWAAMNLTDTNHTYVVLEAKTGVNVYTSITDGVTSSTLWGRFSFTLTSIDGPFTAGLDEVAELKIVNALPFSLASLVGHWVAYDTAGTLWFEQDIDGTAFRHDDVDGDGLVSPGDTLFLTEPAPVLDAQIPFDSHQSLYLTAPDGASASGWDALQ
jgi:hypothetical protein